MIFLWILLALCLGLAAIIVGYSLYVIFSARKPDYVPSLSSTWAVVDRVIAERVLPTQGLILDLGCNDGRTLRRLCRAGYQGPFVGYENKLVPWLLGRLWSRLTGASIEIRREDFMHAPIEQAQGIYLFLLDSTLARLAPVLRAKARPGTVIVSAEFAIPGWRADKIFRARGITSRQAKIYVYQA